jgi:hypothetical protein
MKFLPIESVCQKYLIALVYAQYKQCQGRYIHMRQLCSNEMIRVCKSCGKEFQSFNEGAIYSSSVMGILDFCSDECCRKYLNANISKQYHGEQKG